MIFFNGSFKIIDYWSINRTALIFVQVCAILTQVYTGKLTNILKFKCGGLKY